MSIILLEGVDSMIFEMDLDGYNFIMDAGKSVGGLDYGPRPK